MSRPFVVRVAVTLISLIAIAWISYDSARTMADAVSSVGHTDTVPRACDWPSRPGQMSDTEVQVTAGLHANDTILVHPSDQIHDGVRVSTRR